RLTIPVTFVIGYYRHAVNTSMMSFLAGESAMWASEFFLDFAAFGIHRRVPKHDLFTAAKAFEDIRPDRILDCGRAFAFAAGCAVKPIELRLQLLHNPIELGLQRLRINRVRIVVCDVACRRRKIAEDGLARAKFRSSRNDDAFRRLRAHHRRYTGHSAAAEGIEH